MSAHWIDVTRRMDPDLICWPGRTPPNILWTKRLDRGDHCNVSAWQISAHTGTHIDAPLHFINGGAGVDEIAPDVLIGSCYVSTIANLDVRHLPHTERLIIKTEYSGRTAFEHHPSLMTRSEVRALLDAGLRLIGTDRLSVDDTRTTTFELHHEILGRGCVIVEGLDLSAVNDGHYEMVALPLRMAGAEASPARVLLRTLAPPL